MVYDGVLFTFNTPRVAGTFAAAQERGSLTQELVILVILIVIALALILLCGVMGRHKEEEIGEEVGGTKPELESMKTESATQESRVSRAEESVVTPEPVSRFAEPSGVQESAAPSEPVSKLAEPVELQEPITPSEPAEPPVVQESAAPSEPVSKLAEPVEPREPTAPPESAEPPKAQEPVAPSAPLAETVKPAAAPPRPDDLKVIEGIGPKVSKVLNEAGIFTFAQLAEADPAHLKQILEAAKWPMMNPESWPEQARLAANGDWDELKALQDRLKGGRY